MVAAVREGGLLDARPDELAARLARSGEPPALLWREPATGELRASHPALEPLAAWLAQGAEGAAQGHEAVFLAAGPQTGALFGAFLHRTARGQAQGGLRRQAYGTLREFLVDGLRLAHAMGRKCALAGLWWGGGKGLIAPPSGGPEGAPEAGSRPERGPGEAPDFRRRLYREYGAFVSALRGCYVTAEDAGTAPEDMAAVFERTRFATCIPPALGGSGSPAEATARGVVAGMEAALEAEGLGPLAGKRVAVQGLGNVGLPLVERLLERRVAGIVASETNPARCDAARERLRGAPVEVRDAAAGDASILGEPCDVLAPNALGAVLDDATVPGVRARVVCGAANNPLADEARHARALHERGVLYVPDYIVNRMGIVQCANEQYGSLEPDPAVERHLDPAWEASIPATVRRVLAQARAEGVPPLEAAERLADALAEEPHPIWGHRAAAIVASLAREAGLETADAPRSAARRSAGGP